jgi:hypothetical protein
MSQGEEKSFEKSCSSPLGRRGMERNVLMSPKL